MIRTDDEDRVKIRTDRVIKLPDETILSYEKGGTKSTLLLHPMRRTASVTKGIHILITSHLVLSIAEGPVGAHRRAAAAQLPPEVPNGWTRGAS